MNEDVLLLSDYVHPDLSTGVFLSVEEVYHNKRVEELLTSKQKTVTKSSPKSSESTPSEVKRSYLKLVVDEDC